VRKAVELGVAAIAPVQSARSQRIPALREERRIQHWQQIAVAACEQCGRNRVPDVRHIVPFGDWLDSVQSGHIVILDADAGHSLAAVALKAMPALVAIGPEGGFTLEEVQSATNRGASAVHLGGRMLRAETAALAALATVNAVAGDAR
jgi:16S rRNA (uracil1498-N3)-methyltransferase